MVLGIPSVGIAKSRLVGTVEGSQPAKLVQGRHTLGYVTGSAGGTRYWSPGYSMTLRSLRSVMRTSGTVCLRAVGEADRASKEARRSFQPSLRKERPS